MCRPPQMAYHHMRRSAVFAGRFDSRNRLESGETELICLHGGSRLGRLPSLGKVGIEKIVFEILEI